MASRPDVDDQSSVRADGAHVLKLSILIKARRADAWKAFTTSEGLRGWEAPVAAIDLKKGGYLEATYDPKGKLGDPNNIKHQIISFTPDRSITFHNVQTPKGFPYAEAFGKVDHTLTFESAGHGMTRVTITDVAYGDDKAGQWLFKFFHSGNAYVLEALKAYLQHTPPPSESTAHSE